MRLRLVAVRQKRTFEAMMTMKKIDIAPSWQRGEADVNTPKRPYSPGTRTNRKLGCRKPTCGDLLANPLIPFSESDFMQGILG